MSLALGKRLNLRLFIEGVEVPVISANVNANIGSPAIANIQIIPTAAALNLCPRSMVHLFFYDKYAMRIMPDGKIVPEDEDMKYALLFMGEMIGYNYSKSATGRSLTLQCIDFSSYWQVAYAYYLEPNGTPSDLIEESAKFVQASTGILHGAAGNNHGLVLSQLLFESPKSPEFSKVQGLLGGIIRIIEVMTGVQGEQGINDFFTYAELRCHLLAQIGAPEADTQAKDLLKSGQIESWITDKVQTIGSLVSLREIIDLLLSYIYYEVVPNPTPKFVTPEDISKEEAAIDQTSVSTLEKIALLVQDAIDALGQEDTENALSSVEQIIGDSAITAAMSTGTSDEIVNNAMSALSKLPLGGLLAELNAQLATTTGKITQIKADALRAPLNIATAKILAANAALVSTRNDLVVTASATLEGILQSLLNMRDAGTVTTTQKGRPKVYTTLFRPNIFYAPAPTCNVIFPEQYHTLSYDRQFLAEITRMHLALAISEKANIGVEFPDVMYAPNTDASLNELQTQWSASNPTEIGRLMPHEYHLGIIPAMATLSRLQFYTKESMEQAKIADEGPKLYAQRLANFKFFEERFRTRSLNLSGPFNPNPVVGFPAVIIDRPILAPNLKSVADVDKYRDKFNQYIAVPSAISHIVDQGMGGSTQINCLYARTHHGRDDEFLRGTKGLLGFDLTKTDKTVLDYAALVNSGDLDKLNILFNVTTKTGDDSTIPRNLLGTVINVPKYPGGTIIGSKGIKNTIVAIEVLDSSPAGQSFSEAPQDESVASETPNSFSFGTTVQVDAIMLDSVLRNHNVTLEMPVYQRVAVYELKDQGVLEDIQLPVEEVIRPIWVSKIYRNPDIGKSVYTPLLGVQSIVDQNMDGAGIIPVTFDGEQFISSEKAVDFITLRYSLQRQSGSTNDFVEGYTKRPIATLRQMLGSADGTEAGLYSKSFRGEVPLVDITQTVIRGVDLYNVNCEPASPHIPPAYLDTRKEKFTRVWEYRTSLSSRGLAG